MFGAAGTFVTGGADLSPSAPGAPRARARVIKKIAVVIEELPPPLSNASYSCEQCEAALASSAKECKASFPSRLKRVQKQCSTGLRRPPPRWAGVEDFAPYPSDSANQR